MNRQQIDLIPDALLERNRRDGCARLSLLDLDTERRARGIR